MENKSTFLLSNFIWRFAERVGAQGVTALVSVILARLLDPEVYGTVALVTVLIAVMQVFVDGSLGSALIQKLHADDLDFSTAFFFNLFMGLTLYTAMFFAAPAIAGFYARPELTAVIRVLSLLMVVSSVKNVQIAYVTRTMQFKKFFFSTLGGTVGAAVIGIWLAWRGYGVWALVGQYLFNQVVDTLILWLTVEWRPKRVFSWQRLKGLFSYSWKMSAAILLDTCYYNLRTLIIGKLYTSEELAYYDHGMKFTLVIVENINSSISSVLFPTLSQAQEDRELVKNMTRRAITVSTYLMAPLMIGMAACAEPMIRLIFTGKWLPAVPYLRIFCVVHLFLPIHTANQNAVNAVGRSDLYLRLQIIKTSVSLAALLLTMRYGPFAIACGMLLVEGISQVIDTWPNRELLRYSYLEQLRDILPGILLAVAMGAAVFSVQLLHLNDLATLLIQVPLGAAIYAVGSKLLKLESFAYLWELAKPVLRNVPFRERQEQDQSR